MVGLVRTLKLDQTHQVTPLCVKDTARLLDRICASWAGMEQRQRSIDNETIVNSHYRLVRSLSVSTKETVTVDSLGVRNESRHGRGRKRKVRTLREHHLLGIVTSRLTLSR